MSKKTDWHAQGQHDRKKSRSDGWFELILSGGCGSGWRPPKDSKKRDQYNKGWNNAKRR